MTEFYKATNDKVFKAIFLPESNWNLIKRLIEDATKMSDIEIISVVSPELPKDNIYNKGKTLDVVFKTKDIIYNIEVNVYNKSIFHRRNFAYLATQYTTDLSAGDTYDDMKNHIQINISDSTSKDIPDYDKYEVRGERHNKLFIDNFTIYEFNLSKMDEMCYNNYKFLQILNYSKKELDNCIGDKDMEKFKDEIERVNSDSEFIQLMSADKEEEMYLNTVKHLEYEKGIELGIEQGIEQGINQNSKEIAKNLLKTNLTPEEIASSTGLTVDEVKKLKSV